MVGDQTDIPHPEIEVHTAAGIGNHQLVAAQQPQHPQGEADLLKGIALIGMETALHHRNPLAGQGAEHQLALMAGSRGNGESRNFLVGNHNGVLCQIGHIAQAGAQNHGNLRLEVSKTLGHHIGCLTVISKGITHRISSFRLVNHNGIVPINSLRIESAGTSRESRGAIWESPRRAVCTAS